MESPAFPLEIKIIYIQRGFSISVSLPEGIPRSQVNFLWFSLPCYQRFTKSGRFLVGGWASPSEKWWSSSVGMMTFHSQLFLESHNPAMFQSPIRFDIAGRDSYWSPHIWAVQKATWNWSGRARNTLLGSAVPVIIGIYIYVYIYIIYIIHIYGGFLKWGYLQIHINRIFHEINHPFANLGIPHDYGNHHLLMVKLW